MGDKDFDGHNLSRIRLWRMYRLHQEIKRGQYPNAVRFAQDNECDRKTIHRDIDWMKYALSAPIEYDYARKGYYYTDPVWAFPFFESNSGEYASLMLAMQMSKLYPDAPIAKNIKSFMEKAMAGTEDKNAGVSIAGLQEIVSFHGQPGQIIHPGIWDTIFSALKNHRILRMRYCVFDEDGKVVDIEVEPVHLASVNGDWYLLGYNRGLTPPGWRHYSLSRIVELRQAAEFFPREIFDSDAYFSTRFDRFVAHEGQKIHKVVIRFDKSAAFRVRERHWHPREKLKKHKDGSVTLTLPMPSLLEAKTFCLQWGAQAEVLEPPELRKLIFAEAQAVAKRYVEQ